MTYKSKTAFASRPGASAPFVAGELVLAVLDHDDFSRAQSIVDGFDRWPSFDDYVCERDGLYIGMSCAGHAAQLCSISIRSFERWMLHSGVSASIRALDEFAARIHAFRLQPNLRVEGMPPVEWRSSDQEIGPRRGCFTIPIAGTLYEGWLRTMGQIEILTENPSIDIYARMLMESWADV